MNAIVREEEPVGETVPLPLVHQQAAAEQALRIADAGLVETICIHGDTPGAPRLVHPAREALRALDEGRLQQVPPR